ncbi:MAG: Gfo/Idh/MocA family protein [Planctomycetota bacterium]|jgi:predicted dehydrogenase
MSEGKLEAAVLGLDDKGRLLLKAASGLDYFRIAAVADKDAKLAEKTGKEYDCAAYDDYRQMVIQNQFDCVLVAAGLHSCEEHLRAAIKKRFHVFKAAPPGRNFEEAAGFVQLAEEAEVEFAVGNPKRYNGSFLGLRRYLGQWGVEQVFLITATVAAGEGACPAWQMDPKLAGGGVLLNNCYGIIDQILLNFGVPQEVYSLTASLAGDKQQRQYLTEDTAVVTMKFADNFIANIVASRCGTVSGGQESLRVYARDKGLAVGNSRLVVSDGSGQTSQQLEFDEDELSCMGRQLENFALRVLWPDNNRLVSTARENLNNMAVIESAYLSARTGFPEKPERILQMAGFRPTDMWPAEAG